MLTKEGNGRTLVYVNIMLIFVVCIYTPTYNFTWAQLPFENSNSTNDNRQSFLSSSAQSGKVDPDTKDRIISGINEARDTVKDTGKKIMITALSTLPGKSNNAKPSVADRSNGVGSSPSSVTWEFPSDVQVTGLSNLQVEPDIISSEVDDKYLVAGTIDYSSGVARCRLFSSSDTGASWTSRGNMALPSGTSFQSDPTLATNSKGHFIAACMAWKEDSNRDPTSSAITMQISTDKGVTWSSPTIVAGSTSDISPIFHDKPMIASDASVHSPYRDRTYLCWTQFDFSQRVTNIMVERIQLSIASQRSLATANEDPADIVQGCNVAVGPRGEVAIAWYQASFSDPVTQGRIMVSRSYDGGATWTTPLTITSFTKIPTCGDSFYGCLDGVNGQFRVNSWPDITWDRLDNLLVTYTDYNNGNPDIKFTSSTNCSIPSSACTFFTPIKVNDDSTGRDQFFPSIVSSDKITTVNDRGIVHIVAQDKREDSNNLSWRPWSYHCNLSSGCDSSSEWSGTNTQVAVSSGLFSNEGLSFFVGDYNGLTTGDGVSPTTSRQAHAIWFDNLGAPDIYSDRTTK